MKSTFRLKHFKIASYDTKETSFQEASLSIGVELASLFAEIEQQSWSQLLKGEYFAGFSEQPNKQLSPDVTADSKRSRQVGIWF